MVVCERWTEEWRCKDGCWCLPDFTLNWAPPPQEDRPPARSPAATDQSHPEPLPPWNSSSSPASLIRITRGGRLLAGSCPLQDIGVLRLSLVSTTRPPSASFLGLFKKLPGPVVQTLTWEIFFKRQCLTAAGLNQWTLNVFTCMYIYVCNTMYIYIYVCVYLFIYL